MENIDVIIAKAKKNYKYHNTLKSAANTVLGITLGIALILCGVAILLSWKLELLTIILLSAGLICGGILIALSAKFCKYAKIAEELLKSYCQILKLKRKAYFEFLSLFTRLENATFLKSSDCYGDEITIIVIYTGGAIKSCTMLEEEATAIFEPMFK